MSNTPPPVPPHGGSGNTPKRRTASSAQPRAPKRIPAPPPRRRGHPVPGALPTPAAGGSGVGARPQPNPRRQPRPRRVQPTSESSTRHKRRVTFSLLVAGFVALGGIWVAGQSDLTAKPMALNGDQLGQNYGESAAEYQLRAMNSLSRLDESAPTWALVTFRSPQTAVAAADIAPVDKVLRVSAMIEEGLPPIELPEPVAGATRAGVFTHANALIRISGKTPGKLTGLVVYAPKQQLMALASNPDVFSVEALPADAVWGRFGITPVTP